MSEDPGDFCDRCGHDVCRCPRSTVNRVRTPSDDVVDAWWEANVMTGTSGYERVLIAEVLYLLAQQPEAVQRGVLRKARGQ